MEVCKSSTLCMFSVNATVPLISPRTTEPPNHLPRGPHPFCKLHTFTTSTFKVRTKLQKDATAQTARSPQHDVAVDCTIRMHHNVANERLQAFMRRSPDVLNHDRRPLHFTFLDKTGRELLKNSATVKLQLSSTWRAHQTDCSSSRLFLFF
jgi:hypothetical protein